MKKTKRIRDRRTSENKERIDESKVLNDLKQLKLITEYDEKDTPPIIIEQDQEEQEPSWKQDFKEYQEFKEYKNTRDKK